MSMLRELLSLTGNGTGGVNVLSGTDSPDDAVGVDGDVYLRLEFVTDGFEADVDYVVANTTQKLCTHSAAFYKTDPSPAICVHWKNGGGYYGPVLVSTIKNAVKYTTSTSDANIQSFESDGVTWYRSYDNYWDQSKDSPTIPPMYDHTDVSDKIERARLILAASHARALTGYLIKEAYVKSEGVWTKRYTP